MGGCIALAARYESPAPLRADSYRASVRHCLAGTSDLGRCARHWVALGACDTPLTPPLCYRNEIFRKVSRSLYEYPARFALLTTDDLEIRDRYDCLNGKCEFDAIDFANDVGLSRQCPRRGGPGECAP